MRGCSLARTMAVTIPRINHLFRTSDKNPETFIVEYCVYRARAS